MKENANERDFYKILRRATNKSKYPKNKEMIKKEKRKRKRKFQRKEKKKKEKEIKKSN